VALVQPTLFEGTPGGLAVADAVSLGVPVIASDIPVNREISEGEVSYFKPGSVLDLAEKMELASRRQYQRLPNDELESRSRANLRKLGNALYETCFGS
jgi:glycosyltransferase involved in cell wall biosynthesis